MVMAVDVDESRERILREKQLHPWSIDSIQRLDLVRFSFAISFSSFTCPSYQHSARILL